MDLAPWIGRYAAFSTDRVAIRFCGDRLTCSHLATVGVGKGHVMTKVPEAAGRECRLGRSRLSHAAAQAADPEPL
jgi:hypothetical protein